MEPGHLLSSTIKSIFLGAGGWAFRERIWAMPVQRATLPTLPLLMTNNYLGKYYSSHLH